jgi:hypothetical protein
MFLKYLVLVILLLSLVTLNSIPIYYYNWIPMPEWITIPDIIFIVILFLLIYIFAYKK